MKKIRETIDRKSFKPVKVSHKKAIRFAAKKEVFVADRYGESLEELFLLRNPKYRFNKEYRGDFKNFAKKHCNGKSMEEMGNWFYFPWSNRLAHFLPENLHQELRTGRNRNLITKEEQKRYYNSNIGILGMSVGSHAALTIAMTGGAKTIKLADPDTISPSNLNRIRTGFTEVGLGKAVFVARQIYEMNPYAKVMTYTEGVTDKNMEGFFARPKLDVLVEEMDNPYFKIMARFLARKHHIPVIMAADNGDGIIVDVERYDLKRNLPILHGILGNIKPDDFKNISPKDLPGIIAKMAGANLATPRMLKSVLEVGKSLYSWPQLGTAATLCGATLAYLARKIVVGGKVESGRKEFNPDSVFEPGYSSQKSKMARKAEFQKFLKKIKNS